MATLTFDSTSPAAAAAEARATVAALRLWLAEQPKPEAVSPARATCRYGDDGQLEVLTVTIGEGK